mmetsp:Transcript_50855/g.51740  ORF Transcript_50855/g.51740 Transcript_50855/m.51740 type:complete len:82 (+) Transcript_50855:671-916(+)
MYNLLTIQCLVVSMDRNEINKMHTILKAVGFIHLFVALAIEFNSFDEEEQGGILLMFMLIVTTNNIRFNTLEALNIAMQLS